MHAVGANYVSPSPPPAFSRLLFVRYTALESSHAIWAGLQLAKTMPKDEDIVIVGVFFFVGLCSA